MEEEKFKPFHFIYISSSLPSTAFGRGHQNLFRAADRIIACLFLFYLHFVTKRGVGGEKVTAMDLFRATPSLGSQLGPVYDFTYLLMCCRFWFSIFASGRRA
jgi:hypothetical protein